MKHYIHISGPRRVELGNNQRKSAMVADVLTRPIHRSAAAPTHARERLWIHLESWLSDTSYAKLRETACCRRFLGACTAGPREPRASEKERERENVGCSEVHFAKNALRDRCIFPLNRGGASSGEMRAAAAPCTCTCACKCFAVRQARNIKTKKTVSAHSLLRLPQLPAACLYLLRYVKPDASIIQSTALRRSRTCATLLCARVTCTTRHNLHVHLPPPTHTHTHTGTHTMRRGHAAKRTERHASLLQDIPGLSPGMAVWRQPRHWRDLQGDASPWHFQKYARQDVFLLGDFARAVGRNDICSPSSWPVRKIYRNPVPQKWRATEDPDSVLSDLCCLQSIRMPVFSFMSRLQV